MNDFDRGWLIGILEGEGTFGYYGAPEGTQRVAVEMTDEDTILKLAAFLSEICGVVIKVATKDRSYQAGREKQAVSYCVQVTGKRARAIMKFAVPYLSYRRRARIWRALNGYTEPKKPLHEVINLTELIAQRRG